MLLAALTVMFIIGLLFGLSAALTGRLITGPNAGLTIGLVGGLLFVLISGGEATLKHLILRIFLWHYNYAPLNYPRFLDYCTERIFLRKVGGSYIFIHRLLMEHFAEMTDEDIERIASGIK
jgi:hypothetical protein